MATRGEMSTCVDNNVHKPPQSSQEIEKERGNSTAGYVDIAGRAECQQYDDPSLAEPDDMEQEQSDTKVSVLLIGKTGNGKSTLINSFFNKNIINTSENVSRGRLTKTVQRYLGGINGVNFVIYDTPGLTSGRDEDVSTFTEEVKRYPDHHLTLLCINMTEARLTTCSPDVRVMQVLTDIRGKDSWKHTAIILTFANSIPSIQIQPNDDVRETRSIYESELEACENAIRKVLETEIDLPSDIVKAIPIHPAGHYKVCTLYGEEHWLRNLWQGSFRGIDTSCIPNEMLQQLRSDSAGSFVMHDLTKAHSEKVPTSTSSTVNTYTSLSFSSFKSSVRHNASQFCNFLTRPFRDTT